MLLKFIDIINNLNFTNVFSTIIYKINRVNQNNAK